MSEPLVPVTLLLTKDDIAEFLAVTRRNCKIKEKGEEYCSKAKCFMDFNKIENSLVRHKHYMSHNCLKLLEVMENF